jgi:hypothetical protein
MLGSQRYSIHAVGRVDDLHAAHSAKAEPGYGSDVFFVIDYQYPHR